MFWNSFVSATIIRLLLNRENAEDTTQFRIVTKLCSVQMSNLTFIWQWSYCRDLSVRKKDCRVDASQTFQTKKHILSAWLLCKHPFVKLTALYGFSRSLTLLEYFHWHPVKGTMSIIRGTQRSRFTLLRWLTARC